MTRSNVTVWSLIALGVVCGVASAVMLAVAYLVWIAPRKKLLELDLERDAAGVLVYRSFPLLVLSVLIFASTSIVLAAKKPRVRLSCESAQADRRRLCVFVRQAAAACSVSRPVVRRWLSLGCSLSRRGHSSNCTGP
jgi:hypothetical protein